VSFKDIYEQWEKKTGSVQGTDVHGTYDKDAALDREEAQATARGERRARLLRKKPDASIDLHGLTANEAHDALQSFFSNSKHAGFEKLLVIHGKGNHQRNAPSSNNAPRESVVRDTALRFIESCPFAGEHGYSSAKDGGTGATWVILKGK